MDCHTESPVAPRSEAGSRSLILVGNPNVGKSAIFGLLTGSYVNVSNYPGTTVEVTRGSASLDGVRTVVIDTPGANSLTPMSEDELATRSILLDEPDTPVLQVADMKNLRRALALTAQLADLERCGALALNMADEARGRGITVDIAALERIVGVPIAPTIAVRRDGVRVIAERALADRPFSLAIRYSAPIEDAATRIAGLLPPDTRGRRGIALMALAGDETISERLRASLGPEALAELESVIHDVETRYPDGVGAAISHNRLVEIDRVLAGIVRSDTASENHLLRLLTAWSTHRIKGIFILAATLYVTFWFVGLLGAGTFVDFFETVVFGRYVSPASIWLVDHALPFPHTHAAEVSEWTFAIPLTTAREVEIFTTETAVTGAAYTMSPGVALAGWQVALKYVHDFLVGPYGAITMALAYGFAIVLPIVFTFFIVFSILEDSGYLPRLAVMTNKFFRAMGLNGKAVLPMVLGLGCDTMATMTARILETKKERVITTLLLALGVPCSAQLGVILAMVAAISPIGVIWWVGTIVAIMFIVGWLAAKVLPGETSDLVLELPPLRTPQIGNIIVKTLARVEWYLKEVVPLFVLGTALLFVLDAVNALVAIQRFAAPLVQGWLGLPAKATEAFLVGFLRRDYGAAGLFVLQQDGLMNEIQVVVSLVTITLFVPCIANAFMIAKERGIRTAIWMTLFIFPFAFLVGGLVRQAILLTGGLAP